MNILIITSEWPSNKHPNHVPFLVDQVNYLKENGFNTDLINVEAEKNQMILFPSSIYHEAPTNVNDETRITLSFNTFVRGELGNDRQCTKLHIK